MADIVNLRTVRKANARAAKEAQANANRAAFGRTKAEKSAATIEAQRTASLLDGAKRDHRRDDG
ncbi:DUF4169 family protein [Sphingomonas koreensis]|nr:DUF4169 family protein [Sphingomonas koreensis]